jgi:hypothetical protein
MRTFDREATDLHSLRGQERRLDLSRELDLVSEPLALQPLCLRRLQAHGHLVDGLREQAQLGAVAEHQARLEVAAADALEALTQNADRTQKRGHDERHGDHAEGQYGGDDDHLFASRGRDDGFHMVAAEGHVSRADAVARGMDHGC